MFVELRTAAYKRALEAASLDEDKLFVVRPKSTDQYPYAVIQAMLDNPNRDTGKQYENELFTFMIYSDISQDEADGIREEIRNLFYNGESGIDAYLTNFRTISSVVVGGNITPNPEERYQSMITIAVEWEPIP